MLCENAEGQSNVRIESVEYQGACDVVKITANVEPATSAFSFTWFVRDESGSVDVSHVCLLKCAVLFMVIFCDFVLEKIGIFIPHRKTFSRKALITKTFP